MPKSMSDADPTLKDVWRLLGVVNKRFEAFDRQMIEMKDEIGELRAEMRAGFGALKASIEARDFRLDEHGRRISELEMARSQPPDAT